MRIHHGGFGVGVRSRRALPGPPSINRRAYCNVAHKILYMLLPVLFLFLFLSLPLFVNDVAFGQPSRGSCVCLYGVTLLLPPVSIAWYVTQSPHHLHLRKTRHCLQKCGPVEACCQMCLSIGNFWLVFPILIMYPFQPLLESSVCMRKGTLSFALGGL